MRLLFIMVLIFGGQPLAWGTLPSKHFPVDEAMRRRVDFWKRVYTEITSQQGFLHDSEDLSIVYETLTHTQKSRRAQDRVVRRKKRELRNQLRSIVAKDKKNLDPAEEKLLERIGDPPVQKIREMSRQVRFQRGLKDRYYEGLVRSYLYLDRIKEIITGRGLPEALAYLPHVESSFNYQAYSKVGAAGIWQFMRSTGRQYKLRISYVVDERRDPILATKAAAWLLQDNYRRLKTWPLALTAYNHGATSIARAVRRVNSTDISEIVERYNGRRFGFASKNFYATFVATVEISQDPEKFFPTFSKPKPRRYSEVTLDKPVSVAQLVEATGIQSSTIKEYNQAIRSTAFRTNQLLPKGYRLKIPWEPFKELQDYQRKIASIEYVKPKITLGGTHHVSRGENLYEIAKLHKVSIGDIVALNGIQSPSRIYPGMRLKIPGKAGGKMEETKVAKKAPVIKAAEPVKTIDLPNTRSGLIAQMEKLFKETKKNYSEYVPKKDADTFNAEEVRGVNMDNYNLEATKVKKGLYSVVVESDETLGHLADWAKIGVSKLRRANGLGVRSHLRQGQKLKIPMPDGNVAEFYLLRIEFHAALEEDFYENYKVIGTNRYIVRPGDTMGQLAKKFDAPQWLIKKMQPNRKLSSLQAGQVLYLPEVEAVTVQQNALQDDGD